MDAARKLAESMARRLARKLVRREQSRQWWAANKDRVNVRRRKTVDYMLA